MDSRSSTISERVQVAESNGKPIPLTLTLSHGEREQPAAGSLVREVRRADTALGCAESQRRILPLTEGEGWGAGKGDARSANSVGTEVRGSREGPYGFESFILSCLRLCRRSSTPSRLKELGASSRRLLRFRGTTHGVLKSLKASCQNQERLHKPRTAPFTFNGSDHPRPPCPASHMEATPFVIMHVITGLEGFWWGIGNFF